MPANNDRDIVVISDLHMSAGYDSRTGTFHRNEDFFYDETISRFLDHLITQGEATSRPWRLVILGDFLDFLQVSLPEEPGAGTTSSQASVERLEVIGRGHPQVFASLARFLRHGHQVDVVLGNHDIELVWPDVQATFRRIVKDYDTEGIDLNTSLTFHPWILYIPGVLYAEHGQQYDEINSFATLLAPFLPQQNELIELPLGSFFVRYMFNYIEQIDPFADNVKPPTRYVGWALRHHPVLGLTSAHRYATLFVRSLPKTSKLSRAEQRTRREAYRQQVLSHAAVQIGLPPQALEAIDELAVIPALANLTSQLHTLVVRPLIPAFAVMTAILGLTRAVQHLPQRSRRFVKAASAIVALVWRERRLLQPASGSGDYLLDSARQIHSILDKTGNTVPTYVFGHTHQAAHSRLGDEEDSPRYFNSGTWTPIVPEAFSLTNSREFFTFVQLTHDLTTQRSESRLMVWNDASERVEPALLLASGGTKGASFAATVRQKVKSTTRR